MKIAYCLLLILYISSVSILPLSAEPVEQSACLKQVVPLLKERDKVADLDGIWGLFQKTSEFQDNSVQGLSLDNKVNSILFHLDFLCTTISGIPFDELSDYVSANLKEKGAVEFKKELINLGKSVGEIEVWFEFAKFSDANLHRPLDPKIISKTIQLSQPFIKEYLEIAERVRLKKEMNSIIQKTGDLTNQIELFFQTDLYMSQAIHENAQIPYADFDENYGGS
jgi:hypothetical protein